MKSYFSFFGSLYETWQQMLTVKNSRTFLLLTCSAQWKLFLELPNVLLKTLDPPNLFDYCSA